MRIDLLTHDLQFAIIEENFVFLIYKSMRRVVSDKGTFTAGVGSFSTEVGTGGIAHREKIEGIVKSVVDIDTRDYFLGRYPAFIDNDVERLALVVVKAAVTKLPGVKVIHV